MLSSDQKIQILSEKFPNLKFSLNDKYIEIQVLHNQIYEIIKELKEDSKLKYNQLTDLTAIDYPTNEKRFEIP